MEACLNIPASVLAIFVAFLLASFSSTFDNHNQFLERFYDSIWIITTKLPISLFDDVVAAVDDNVVAAVSGHLHSYDGSISVLTSCCWCFAAASADFFAAEVVFFAAGVVAVGDIFFVVVADVFAAAKVKSFKTIFCGLVLLVFLGIIDDDPNPFML